MTRTFSRTVFEVAEAAWAQGEFGPEWDEIRVLARDRGLISPPEGDLESSDWNEDGPSSQRAAVYQAMEEWPNALRRAIRQANPATWFAIVAHVHAHRDAVVARRAEDRRVLAEHLAMQPTRREVRAVLGRIEVALERSIAIGLGRRP